MDFSVSDPIPNLILLIVFQCLENMGVARKLFRLFKSFNEYVKITAIRKGKLPDFEKNLQILARLAFMAYWFFDNLAVLIKVKFLTSFELK